nr:unnamed protein product [Callosobruchus analis]
MTMANPKSYNELRPLTDEELEALAVPLSSSDDEDDQCSGSEVEDDLENYFSPSESEYEPDTSEAESTDSKQYDLARQSYPKAHMNASAAGNVSDTADNGKQNNLGPGLRGKNGHRWCTIPNMRKRISMPSGAAREAQTPLDVFLCLFNDSILEKILIHTNTEIRIKSEKYKTAKATTSQTSRDELLALFGLLVFSGAQKENHLSARDMFDYKMSGSIYRATMSCERFNFLIESLRFDDKTTRTERRQLDRFAPIRDIWDEFICNCSHSYKPGNYITIDEQLLGFRGRCPFRMYIPSKPSRYGIKIVMCCDVGTKYMFDAEPCLHKHTNTHGVPLAEYFVKRLTKVVHGSNRNVTMDNWFTSVSLAEQLLEPPYKLTLVGTMRHNKREVPAEMINLKNRELGDSIFCYDRTKTLVSIKTKRNKSVLILSTMHEGSAICPDTGKPEINIFYNKTKGGVDEFDQMCGSRSC